MYGSKDEAKEKLDKAPEPDDDPMNHQLPPLTPEDMDADRAPEGGRGRGMARGGGGRGRGKAPARDGRGASDAKP